MQPSLTQDKLALNAQLANQGIKQGTEAYDNAIKNYGSQVNDAKYGAILNAGQQQQMYANMDLNKANFQNSAQNQQYNQNLGKANFGNDAKQQMFMNNIAGTGFNNQGKQQTFDNQNTAHNQWLNEQYGSKNQSLNQIATLLGLGQVQNPQFGPGPNNQVANTDTAGITMNGYQQKLAGWQGQQQYQQGMMGGLFGLGAAGIMASDRRLKTDVSFLGWLRDLPIWSYRYIWGGPMQVGVMAQEMLTIRPEAVVVMPNGFLGVDYGRL
jgi:hypothetical protein